MTAGAHGMKVLPELYRESQKTGMIANIGATLVECGPGTLVLEGHLSAEAHGFPTARGTIVHGGALATLADEALSMAAFTLAEEGETTVTADLKVDFLRPARPGRLVARGKVSRRTRRLAFCGATIEDPEGAVVVEARAIVAYVRA